MAHERGMKLPESYVKLYEAVRSHQAKNVVKHASETMSKWGTFADEAMKTHGLYKDSVKHATFIVY